MIREAGQTRAARSTRKQGARLTDEVPPPPQAHLLRRRFANAQTRKNLLAAADCAPLGQGRLAKKLPEKKNPSRPDLRRACARGAGAEKKRFSRGPVTPFLRRLAEAKGRAEAGRAVWRGAL